MSEERLKKIIRESKGVIWNTETDEDLVTELDTPDFNWLIEQAIQNKRNHEVIEQIKNIMLHPLSKTWNKDKTLHKIESILKSLESDPNGNTNL